MSTKDAPGLPKQAAGESRGWPTRRWVVTEHSDLGWTTEQSSLLLELQSIWTGKYMIMGPQETDGITWCAERIGSVGIVTGESGLELRRAITVDAIEWNRQIFGAKT